MISDANEADVQLRRALLRTLASGAGGPEWQEVAEADISGDFTLRQAAESSAFRGLFLDAARLAAEHREEVGEEAAEEERRTAQQVVDDLTERIRREDG